MNQSEHRNESGRQLEKDNNIAVERIDKHARERQRVKNQLTFALHLCFK